MGLTRLDIQPTISHYVALCLERLDRIRGPVQSKALMLVAVITLLPCLKSAALLPWSSKNPCTNPSLGVSHRVSLQQRRPRLELPPCRQTCVCVFTCVVACVSLQHPRIQGTRQVYRPLEMSKGILMDPRNKTGVPTGVPCSRRPLEMSKGILMDREHRWIHNPAS